MAAPLHYLRRVLDDELDELLPQLAAIAVEGPKAVGKTATATQRAAVVHRLDEEAELAVAASDPKRLLEGPYPVLIDEWQKLPGTWNHVRRAVDDDPSPGRFILTGSATPRAEGTHSGAGRIVSLRMRPMSLAERLDEPESVGLGALLMGEKAPVQGRTDIGVADYTEEILRSGFPAIRELEGRARRQQLDGYIQRVVDKDFPELGLHVRNAAALKRWIAAYAAATATTTQFDKIRDASTAGDGNPPARSTVAPYRDVLTRLFVLDEVEGWGATDNQLGRLALRPKHQLADPALATTLLGMNAEALLRGAPTPMGLAPNRAFLGALFESLVTLSVKTYAQAAEAKVRHLRLREGRREIDLIVERADGGVLAIEIKLAATPNDSATAHVKWLRDQIGDQLLDAVIITTGSEAYRRQDGIAVIPAALLGP